MGNVVGTTALQYSINTEVFEPLVLDYLRGALVLANIVRTKDLTGQGSLVWKLASHGSLTAATTTQGTDLTPAAMNEALDGTITAAEVGVAIETTRIGLLATGGRVNEDDLARAVANAVASKIETDIAATFASFNTSVGTTTVDLALTDIEDALTALRVANAPAVVPPNFNLPPQFAGYQCVLHEQQMADFLRALRVAGAIDAFLPPDRAGLAYDAGSKAAGDLRGVYMGIKFYGSTYPATANVGADRVGAMFVPAAIGLATVGGPTIDVENHSLGRSKYIVGSQIYGTGIAKDVFGVKIVTDA